VNPDPKSLWKVIDPPADAPFFKKSIDHRNISSATVNIVAASRRGRSHEHAGTFRDDDFYINVSDESGWNVLLVADGAGSARFSREGSRIVAETVGNYLFSQLKAEKGHEIKDRVLRWNSEDQRAVWDFMNHHFRQAALLAVHNISSAAIMARTKQSHSQQLYWRPSLFVKALNCLLRPSGLAMALLLHMDRSERSGSLGLPIVENMPDRHDFLTLRPSVIQVSVNASV
jgi:hypothetical protein